MTATSSHDHKLTADLAPLDIKQTVLGPVLRPERLKVRREFLRVAEVRRKWAMPGLLLQVARQPGVGPEFGSDPMASLGGLPLRYGLTASRKVGNAVVRNRARRRLRALADEYLPLLALPGHDYVLIARHATPTRDFALLISDLKTALSRLKVARPAPAQAPVQPAAEVKNGEGA